MEKDKKRFVRQGHEKEKLKKSPKSYVKARSPGTSGYAGRLKGRSEKILSDSTPGDDQENQTSAEGAVSEGMEASSSAVREGSNEFSRQMQKKKIRNEYANAKRGTEKKAENIGEVVSGNAKKAAEAAKEGMAKLAEKVSEFVSEHPGAIVLGGCILLLILLVVTSFSSCSMLASSTGGGAIGSSFTAEDADITGVEEDYAGMEAALQSRIDNIESEFSGYDEYRYHLANINHNPFILASYLTVKFEDYKRSEVQSVLEDLFAAQYQLTCEETVEVRSYQVEHSSTSTWTDENGQSHSETHHWTETVYYNYYILDVTLTNNSLEAAVAGMGMTAEEQDRYNLLLTTGGNRSALFADNPYAFSTEGLEYDIPGEALTDQKFARMIQEGEKYLGYPYVWGGASPSTSFDCSGFVSWVINHSGNGWNFGRLTAEGLRNKCSIIRKNQAKPGDLIFFQGTYNTTGASHVGIYVGNGMMLHCGNPIQYTSCETEYWNKHFYCFGRLP